MMTKKEKYITLRCIKFAKEQLNINTPFRIKLSATREGFVTTGYFDPNTKLVAIYTKGRALPDICRTALHEMTHLKDDQDGKTKGKHPEQGKIDHNKVDPNDIENRANAIAGSLLKKFAFGLKDSEGIDIYTT